MFLTDGSIKIQTKIDNSGAEQSLQKLKTKLLELKNNITNIFKNIGKDNISDDLLGDIDGNAAKIELLRRKIDDLKQTLAMAEEDDSLFSKQEVLEMQAEVEKLTKQLKKLEQQESNQGNNRDKSWSKGINKILKYAAALLSIRSIYSLLSGLANSWLNSNDEAAKQLKADIEYMKYAVGSSFKGLLQGIVNILHKILSLSNSIAQTFFGINLFNSAGADEYVKMQKSSEKIKKNMQQTGFDEQNVIQDNSSSSSNNIVTPSFDLSTSDAQLDNFVEQSKSKLDEIIEFWEEDWYTFGESVTGNWDLFIKGLLLTLEGFYLVFKGIWDSIGGVIDIFIGIFTGDTEKIKEGWDKLCQGLLEIITGIFDIIGGLLGTALGFVKGVFLDLWDGIVSVFGSIADWFGERWEDIKQGVSDLCASIGKFFSDIWQGIKDVWNGVTTWFTDTIINPIKNFFSDMWQNLKNGASDAWEGITNVFSNVTNWFKDKFSKAWEAVKNVFSTGGKIFDGIKSGIENVFKTVVNGIIDGINKIISVPFNVINGTLNKIREISFLGISPFKGLWGYNPLTVPQIPKLAKGGIVSQPTQAIIGEAGREAVLPLENNREWMYELADIIAQNSGSQTINLVVDGKVLARVVNDYNKRQQFATGR